MRALLYVATGLAVAFAARQDRWSFRDWFFVVVFWWLYLLITALVRVLLAADRAFKMFKSHREGSGLPNGSGLPDDQSDSGDSGGRWLNGLGSL